MSDLISRSALIKHLTDWRLQECPVGVCEEETETYKTICECIEAVKKQPTAYNVDAVVEELEKNLLHSVDAKAEASIAMSGVSMNMYYGDETAYTKAIEIVKAGGVE